MLKSGYKVQEQLYRTAERLQDAVEIQSVIGWRIMVPPLLGWEVPQCAAKVLFAGEELEFLRGLCQAAKQAGAERPRIGRGSGGPLGRLRGAQTRSATGESNHLGRRHRARVRAHGVDG